jgi:ketosteroid isomerase-like protein
VGQEPSGNVRAERSLKPDRRQAELIEVLDRFCSAFARRDPGAVLRLCAPDLDLVVVTSEESLLRGPAELRRFLARYVKGSTTYSWGVGPPRCLDNGAWLLAEGTETAASEERVARHPYRMTMVPERHADRWLVRHVHRLIAALTVGTISHRPLKEDRSTPGFRLRINASALTP